MIDDFCSNKDISGFGNLQDTIKDIDYHLRNETSKYMCTPECPCISTLDLNKWKEDDLNDYNRTMNSSTLVVAKSK